MVRVSKKNQVDSDGMLCFVFVVTLSASSLMEYIWNNCSESGISCESQDVSREIAIRLVPALRPSSLRHRSLARENRGN